MAPLPADRSPVPLGFAGLASLVSDVDGLIATIKKTAAVRSAGGAASGTLSRKGGTADGPSRTPASVNPKAGSTSAWVWGTVGVLFLLWLIAVASNNSGKSSTSPSYAGSGAAPSTTTKPYEATPSTQQTASLPAQASATQAEQVPPIGTNRVLGAAEIRYCLSEDIRLEAARDTVSANDDVERFNAMVNDYNRRCGNYQYRPSVFQSIQRQVEANRTSLQIDGIARFQR